MSPARGAQPQGHATFKFGNSEFYLPEVPAISGGEVVLKCDSLMSAPFRDWLSARIRGNAKPSDGSVHLYKYDNDELLRHQFTMALVSSISFPALDAASGDFARLTVKLKAKSIAQVPGSGKLQAVLAKGPSPWRCRDFRLVIEGLNSNKVSHIDSINLLNAGPFPNVKATIAALDAPAYTTLKQSGKTVAAKLRFLFPDLQKAAITLEFSTQVVSILAVPGSSPVPGGPGGGSVAKTTVWAGRSSIGSTRKASARARRCSAVISFCSRTRN